MVEDIQKGIIDRFRSLPMAPSAVLTGRTSSDVLINVISLVVMSLTGLLVGWRIHSSFLEAVAGYALLLFFAYALSWVMAVVGLWIRTPEVFNNASFIVIFPLSFIANTFVETTNLPGPLKVIAEWNPVSAVTQAVRELFGQYQSCDDGSGCVAAAESGHRVVVVDFRFADRLRAVRYSSVSEGSQPLTW